MLRRRRRRRKERGEGSLYIGRTGREKFRFVLVNREVADIFRFEPEYAICVDMRE